VIHTHCGSVLQTLVSEARVLEDKIVVELLVLEISAAHSIAS